MAEFDPAHVAAARYDATSIAFHWITVALIGTLWIVGQTINDIPRGAWRIDYRSVHFLLGATLGGVILGRMAWRRWRGDEVPELGGRLAALAARVVHFALYALVLGTVALGVLTALGQGANVFGLFSLPQLGLHAAAHRLRGLHSLAANAILILAGLHAAAALGHHFVLRDPTLRRMLPARRRATRA